MLKDKYTFEDLVAIVARLSAPDGCPWDRVQTHESILSSCIEEAYEVLDAVGRGDRTAIIEELGDLMLQSVFHADIARRENNFCIDDILYALCSKLISRHSHVFGDSVANDAQDSIAVWEANKDKEKVGQTLQDKLQAIPKNLPALMRATKVIRKMDKANLALSKDIQNTAAYSREELEADLIQIVRRAVACDLDAEMVLASAIDKLIG